MPEPIVVTRFDSIVEVMLHRPEKLNALDKAMWLALGSAFEALSQDASVRCIVVRGAGQRAFSPGADIGEFETERCDSGRAAEYGGLIERVVQGMERCPHPMVAQIHGVCVGGGLLVAALCDIRICGRSSRFGIPVKNLGLVEAYAELAPLVRLAGPDTALEILLEGRVFGAEEAREKRLVTRIVDDDRVEEEAMASARRIAAGAPLAARWHKKFVRRLADPAPISTEEKRECFACFDTRDFRIGREAFMAKREPRFVGE